MARGLVQEFLEASADRLPDKEALACGGQRLTYAQIESQANRLANALRARGLQRGDRVLLYLPNSVELVVGIFAALKAGGVFVVVNPGVGRDKLAYILANCQATALLSWSARADIVASLIGRGSSLKTIILAQAGQDEPVPDGVLGLDSLLAGSPATRPAPVNIDLDLACLIYTSGSTGDPKGVMSDHSNVVFAVDAITTYLENVEDDVVIDVLPLSFDYGLYQLLMVFRFGGRLVLEQGFAYPAEIMTRVGQERVTGFPGVPTLYSMLVSMDLSHFDLSSLRYMTNTAAALPTDHILRLRDKFPQVRLYSMYGLTETKRTLYLPPEELERRPDSVGIAIPGTEVWLEGEDGRRLRPGETGELVVRGRHVMRGYWGDPAASAERFRPGALPGERLCYTGDLFRTDDEGFLYFVARKDDIIKSRGEKVSPREIENVLYRLPGVQAVAVIGVPHPVLGQAIKAFVVQNGAGLTEADVIRHCRSQLEDFMVPRLVEFCAALPMTTSGKIKKTGLR